jgi:hypothetical protein
MPESSSNGHGMRAVPPRNGRERATLIAADRVLYVVHVAVTLLIAFGWMLPATRLINWYLIVLTFLSWSVLGWVLRSGYGFCFLTGIQSVIRRRLGHDGGMESFIRHVLRRVTGRDLNPLYVEMLVQAGFYVVAAISLYVNFLRDRV